MKKLIFILAIVVMFVACKDEMTNSTAPAPESTVAAPASMEKTQSAWSSCDKWASYTSGGYTVYNDVWGSGAGTQCIYANSSTNWYVYSTQSGSGVKSYPNSSKSINRSNTSSCSSSMSVSHPGSGAYNASWDIWIPGEMMVWIVKQGSVGPIGSLKYSSVSVGGGTWNVYQGSGVVSFIKTSNSSSASIDVKALCAYCISKGWASSGSTIGQVQGGFEITSTGGSQKTFTMNSYSVN
jgi:Glycosyl hydrolase family 12.